MAGIGSIGAGARNTAQQQIESARQPRAAIRGKMNQALTLLKQAQQSQFAQARVHPLMNHELNELETLIGRLSMLEGSVSKPATSHI